MTTLQSRDTIKTLNQCLARLQRRLALKLQALQRRVRPANVHEARSAVRRLHAILAICRHYVSVGLSRKCWRVLKRVSRKLGQLGDMHVAQQSTDKLAPVTHRLRSDERKSLAARR